MRFGVYDTFLEVFLSGKEEGEITGECHKATTIFQVWSLLAHQEDKVTTVVVLYVLMKGLVVLWVAALPLPIITKFCHIYPCESFIIVYRKDFINNVVGG